MSKPVLQAFGMTLHRHSFGEAGWIILGQVGSILGSLVGLKVLTQLLPKEIYGQVNLLAVAMILPGWILFAPFLHAAVRMYAPSRETGELGPLLRTSLFVYIAMSVLVTTAGLLLISIGSHRVMGLPRIALLLTLLVFLADTWQLLGTGICGAARLRKRAAGIATFTAWGRPLCAGAWILGVGPSVFAVMAGYLMVPLMILPLAFGPILSAIGGPPKIQRETFRRMARYGTPYTLWGALAWGQNYVDRYFLHFALGSTMVGPYAAAYQVAALPFNFGIAFLAQFITPIVFERVGAGLEPARLASGKSLVRLSVWLFSGLGAVAILGYALAGNWIMGLLTPTDYIVPSGILAILAAGALAQNLALLLTTSVLAHNRPEELLWAFLPSGLLSLPLSWLGVRWAGMWGAAMANTATSLIFLAMVGWVVRYSARSSQEALREKELVEELRRTVRKLPPVPAPGPAWISEQWLRYQTQLRDLVLHRDPRRFLSFGIIQHAAFVGSTPYIFRELDCLKKRKDWKSRLRKAIQESSCGNPRRYLLYPQTSPNLIHHAYHLGQFEERTGLSISHFDFLVEFGGGYGCMCRLIHRLGFQGRYILFDLPEFCALQRFFLKFNGIPVGSGLSLQTSRPRVFTISQVDEFQEIMEDLRGGRSAFLATWSISEVPLELRKVVLAMVTQCQAFLFAYQEQFEGIDNVAFFSHWKTTLEGRVSWYDFPIHHLPGNRYLFGIRSKDASDV